MLLSFQSTVDGNIKGAMRKGWRMYVPERWDFSTLQYDKETCYVPSSGNRAHLWEDVRCPEILS